MERQRIDLAGVELFDPDGANDPVAAFRYRTVEGIVLSMPDRIEIMVRWDDLERAVVDLASGRVVLRFAEPFAAKTKWLRGARNLVGEWTDRVAMTRSDVVTPWLLDV